MRWSRRELLVAGGQALMLAACAGSSSGSSGGDPIAPTDPAVERRDALRRRVGAATVTAAITAAPVTVDIGGRDVSTWAFGERPGTGGIRANVGDLIEATFVNRLPSANTLHWHGIALRNDMDGVHDLTQPAVEPDERFIYRFTVPDAGTYWFHPHMGLELDKGLYAPLIVEDPDDPVGFDVDATLILDDWLDGHGPTQAEVLADLQAGGGHLMDTSGTSGEMDSSGGTGHGPGGLAGDVTYPLHVINGRAPSERETINAKPQQRVRVRLINAGSDTAYRVAIGGHRLTVTHSDGFPVVPVDVDNVVLGMGERYDVIFTAGSGAFPIVAVPEDKTGPGAEAVLRTSPTASAPTPGSRPTELEGRTIAYADLTATDDARLTSKAPDRTETITLTASESGYVQGINGASFPDTEPITIAEGERLRLTVVNDTMMFHPIHLHGHTFQLVGAGSARKDTVNVLPRSSVAFDLAADNPGQWMLHCHNTYHLETGMATVLSYRA
jgi:multicopper oxidase